jgi:hypothetical protein
MKRYSLEALSFLYLAAYAPYIVLTRWLATTPDPALGRSMSGLEILPASLILSGVLTYGFVWGAGWWKLAHQRRLGPLRIAVPTRWTALSGVCTAFILFTVPLSFTFPGVSIPFIQLLMRGDVLVVAPLVDLATGRKVRWYSWTALVLASAGIALTLRARGGFHLPPLAVLTVIFYTVGYFGRLMVMTRIAKSGETDQVKSYFVEEKIVAIPLAVAMLALISVLGLAGQRHELAYGFIGVWSSGQLGWLAILSALLFVVSVFSALILLDRRENTFCVPLERSASILAGMVATYWLFLQFHQPAPSVPELIGAVLLVMAIALLSLGPRLGLGAAGAAAAKA